jgi:hypothetical protein
MEISLKIKDNTYGKPLELAESTQQSISVSEIVAEIEQNRHRNKARRAKSVAQCCRSMISLQNAVVLGLTLIVMTNFWYFGTATNRNPINERSPADTHKLLEIANQNPVHPPDASEIREIFVRTRRGRIRATT